MLLGLRFGLINTDCFAGDLLLVSGSVQSLEFAFSDGALCCCRDI